MENGRSKTAQNGERSLRAVMSGVSGGLYEPLTTPAVLSGVTDKVRLGTSLLKTL
jgi:hypothetical protein